MNQHTHASKITYHTPVKYNDLKAFDSASDFSMFNVSTSDFNMFNVSASNLAFDQVTGKTSGPPTATSWTDTSNDWKTPSCWSNGVPASVTAVTIPAPTANGRNFTVTISNTDTATASSITLETAFATILDEGALTVSGLIMDQAGTILLAGNTPLSAGTLALAGAAATIGTSGGNGTLAAYLSDIGGTISLANGTTLLLDNGGTLDGTVTSSGTAVLDLTSGVFNVAGNGLSASDTGAALSISGGTLTLGNNQLFQWNGEFLGGCGSILSSGSTAGTFETTGVTTIAADGIVGTEILNLGNQIIWLNTGTANVGYVAINGVAGIAVDANGSASSATIENKGTFDFNGGFINGAGGSGSTLTTEGIFNIQSDTVTIGSNNQQIIWQNGGSSLAGTINDDGSLLFGSGEILNTGGSVFNITGNGSMAYATGGSSAGSFTNDGILNVGSGLTESIIVLTNNYNNGANIGTINLGATSTLSLGDGGILSGDVIGTGTLQLAGGNFSVASSGNGTAAISSSVALTLCGNSNFTSNTMSVIINAGSTFSLANQITVGTGVVDLLGTSNSVATLDTTGTVTIDNAITLGDYLTWNNTGTINDQGTIGFGASSGDTATLDNAANAQFNFATNGANLSPGAGAGVYSFDNAGTINVADDITATINVVFDDAKTGTISLGTSSILDLNDGGTISAIAGKHFVGSGTLAVTGGDLSLSTSLSLGTVTLALEGNGLLIAGGSTGTTTLSNSTFLFESSASASYGLSGVSGNTFVTVGSSILENGSEYMSQVTWLNQGTIRVSGGATLTTSDGSANEQLDNAGTIQLSSGTATLDTVLDNTGIISLGTGATLSLGSGGTLGGTLSGAGTLDIASGNCSLSTSLALGTATLALYGGTLTVNSPTGTTTLSNSAFLFGATTGFGTLSGGASSGTFITVGSSTLENGDESLSQITWANQGTIQVSNGATITTADLSATEQLINSGTILLSNGSNGTFNTAFDSTGSISLGTGATLSLDNGGTLGGTISGAGTLYLGRDGEANTFTGLTGLASSVTLDINGSNVALAANSTLTLANTIVMGGYNGGTLSGSSTGAAELITTGSALLSNGGSTWLSQINWVNDGTLSLVTGAWLQSGGAGTLTNASALDLGNGISGTISTLFDDTGSINLGTNSVLTLFENSGSLAGSIVGVGAASTLELEISNFTANGHLTVSDATIVSTSSTMTFMGSLTNNGTFDLSSESTLTSSASVTGTGTITIGSGSLLSLQDGCGAGQNILFGASSGGSLDLASPLAFAGTIQDFGGSNAIDLGGISSNDTLSFSGSVLTITQGGSTVASLHFEGNYTTNSFTLTADNHGGSLLQFV